MFNSHDMWAMYCFAIGMDNTTIRICYSINALF